MHPKRIEYFSSLTDEEIDKLTYRDFTTTEMNELINELITSQDRKSIARALFVNRLTISQCSELSFKDIKTIKQYKKRLSKALKITLKRLCPNNKNTE